MSSVQVDIFSQIQLLVQQTSGAPLTSITRETRIVQDLRLDGDDGFELIEKYRKQFKVDMTEFRYTEYFADEGFDLIGAIRYLIWPSKRPKFRELTIGELENAAILGRWIEKQ